MCLCRRKVQVKALLAIDFTQYIHWKCEAKRVHIYSYICNAMRINTPRVLKEEEEREKKRGMFSGSQDS